MDLFSKIKAVVPHMWFQNGNSDLRNDSSDLFEVRKRNIRQSSFRNMLKKRFIVQKQCSVDDPRSPSCMFQRSPILRQNEEKNPAFSPFNVDEMLQTVEERLLISTPKKGSQNKDSENSFNDSSRTDLVDDFPDDDQIIGSIQADWNDFEFQQRDDSIPESLRVETSRYEQTPETNEDEQSQDEANAEQSPQSQEVKSNFDCKVVAFIEKKVESKENVPSDVSNTPKTSTPVKNINQIKRLDKRAALTPLRNMAKNSPAVTANIQTSKILTKDDKEFNENVNINGNKKKKINSHTTRRLLKAPNTPLTPLFKARGPVISAILQDQENL